MPVELDDATVLELTALLVELLLVPEEEAVLAGEPVVAWPVPAVVVPGGAPPAPEAIWSSSRPKLQPISSRPRPSTQNAPTRPSYPGAAAPVTRPVCV
jgi:hypothetical protein